MEKLPPDRLGRLAQHAICVKRDVLCFETGETIEVLGNEVTLMRLADQAQASQGRGIRDRPKKEQTLLSYLVQQSQPRKPATQQVQQKPSQQPKSQKAQVQQIPATQAKQAPEARTQQTSVVEERRPKEQHGQDTDPVTNLVIAMGGTEEARQLVLKALAYLSRYPSVGIIRFVDDVAKLAKVRREQVSRLLDAMRSLGIVDVVDGAVVNLKKRIEVKVRLGI